MKKIFLNLNKISTVWKLITIFILAFLIRLAINIVFQGLNSPPDPDVGADHVEYDILAQNLVSGKGFVLDDFGLPTTERPPGVSFLLFPIYYIFGVNYILARIMFCLLGAGTCIIVYFISKKILNETFSIITALFLAFYPMHFYYSSHLFSEVPWAFFMSLAVWWTILFQEKQQIRYGILVGIAVGISTYIRPTALFYLPFYSFLCFVYFWKIPKILLKLVLTPIFITILILIPWTVRNYYVTGHLVLISTHGGVTFLGAHNEKILNDPKEIGSWIRVSELEVWAECKKMPNNYELDKAAYRYGIDFVKNHIKDMPKLELMKLYRLITPIYNTPNKMFNLIGGLGWGLIFPFVILGILISWKNRIFLSLHSAVLLTLFIALVFYGSHRFRESISPMLMIYTSVGLSYLQSKIYKS